MKGLLLSLIIFALYVMATTIASHFLKPQRHSSFFLGFLVATIFVFLLTYYLTPSDFWILAPSWKAHYSWMDVILSLSVLVLNVHSYVDWFFGFNGGFSTSLMLLLLRYELLGATSNELITHYVSDDGIDKIHAWRLPRLETTGYLTIDPQTQICSLTLKGKLVASLSSTAKNSFSLGLGG